MGVFAAGEFLFHSPRMAPPRPRRGDAQGEVFSVEAEAAEEEEDSRGRRTGVEGTSRSRGGGGEEEDMAGKKKTNVSSVNKNNFANLFSPSNLCIVIFEII